MYNLSKNEDVDTLISENKVVILQFGTESCAPCKAIKMKLDEWGAKHPDILIRYIPVEQFPETAAQRNVLSSPSLFLYVNGKCTLKEAGYFSLEDFLHKTERYLLFV